MKPIIPRLSLGRGRVDTLAKLQPYLRRAEEQGDPYMSLQTKMVRFLFDKAGEVGKEGRGRPGKTQEDWKPEDRAFKEIAEYERELELTTDIAITDIRNDAVAKATDHPDLQRIKKDSTRMNKITEARRRLRYKPLGHERAARRRKAESPEA